MKKLRLPAHTHKVLIAITILILGIIPGSVRAASTIDAGQQSGGSMNIYNHVPEEEANTALGSKATDTGLIPDTINAMCSFFVGGGGYNCPTERNKVLYQLEQLPDGEEVIIKYNGSGGSFTNATMELTSFLFQQRTASAVVAMDDVMNRLFRPDYVAAQSIDPYFPGTGFDLLRPVQAFWGWSVTVAYSLMILIVIIVAIGLLFQGKLPGGRVVQLQSAIPNIILAMILIPLSYPITGLFIDGITLGSNIAWGAFFSESGFARQVFLDGEYNGQWYNATSSELNSGFSDEGTRGLYIDDVRITPFNARGAFLNNLDFSKIFSNNTRDIQCISRTNSSEEIGCEEALRDADPVTAITETFLGVANGLSSMISPIFKIFLSIITIVTAIRIMWKLLKRFLMMLFIPPLAPFWFVSIAIPGTGTKTIMQYVRLLGSITVSYLVAYVMILMTIVMSNDAFLNGIPGFGQTNYNPPLIGLGGIDDVTFANKFIFSIIAAGIYLSIPSTLDSIAKAMGVDTALSDIFKRPFEEAKLASRVAFQQAPGVAYAATRRVATIGGAIGGGLYRGGAFAYSNLIGNKLTDPNNPFSDTRAQEWIDKDKKEYLALQQRAAQYGALDPRRAILNARAAAVAARGNFVGGFTSGESPEIGKGGYDPSAMKFKFSISFTDDERGGESFRLKTSPDGTLTIANVEEGPKLSGTLTFNTKDRGGSNFIAKLVARDKSAGEIYLKLDLPTAPTVQISDKPKQDLPVIITDSAGNPIDFRRMRKNTQFTTSNDNDATKGQGIEAILQPAKNRPGTNAKLGFSITFVENK